jgi:hypothetical protein
VRKSFGHSEIIHGVDLDIADGEFVVIVHPGTVLYLGVDGGVDRVDGRRQATRRNLFVKASYLFRR